MSAGSTPGDAALRCPLCGRGTLRDLAYDEGPPGRPLEQQGDSRQVQVFTCGHEVTGAALDTADGDRLDVERRGSPETVDPPES
jgi:hypothetical protein